MRQPESPTSGGVVTGRIMAGRYVAAVKRRGGERSQGWESRAEQWLAWARTPDHDAYWDYRDAFFALLPAPSGRTLEVGCGEGRVARDLAARGHRVTGLDASPSLVRAAAELDPSGEYVVADAERLPFANETFDLIVAYNSLMDVEDMPGAVREAARVLVAGGRLAVCVTHPFADATSWEDQPRQGRFVVTRSYMDGGPFQVTMERGGLTMTFDGTAHPLQSYVQALEAAGLLIEALREPSPRAGSDADARWAHLPMFLMLRALKP